MKIEDMQSSDVEEVVGIVTAAMNEQEGKWARDTFDFHFKCKAADLNDGKQYFVAKLERVIGIIGMTKNIWGPDDVFWLGWFAVHPDHQRKGIGSQMITSMCDKAKQQGARFFLAETYSDKTFQKARAFYEKNGFKQVGNIDNYMPNANMVVYGKEL